VAVRVSKKLDRPPRVMVSVDMTSAVKRHAGAERYTGIVSFEGRI
jgi:hypothetical protein